MSQFEDIKPPSAPALAATVTMVQSGRYFPPHQQILLYSAAQWEDFIHEWAYFALKRFYRSVQRLSGSGDRGLDVVGFADDAKLQGVWDAYQCKHYDHPLQLTDIYAELGKILWHSFQKHYAPPRRYYLVAPRDAGTKLASHLADVSKLKTALIENWDKYIRSGITEQHEIALEGELRKYVEAFDFSIFQIRNILEVIEDHRRTCPTHATLFGGGLPQRPGPNNPPEDPAELESRYVTQLFDAYGDHKKAHISDAKALKAACPKLHEHYNRQRVAFYHAESLRVFARDNVPVGTFESLQDDVHTGVVDEHDAEHADGYQRVLKVTRAARELSLTSNALVTCVRPVDMDGICHQLANADRLRWVKE